MNNIIDLLDNMDKLYKRKEIINNIINSLRQKPLRELINNGEYILAPGIGNFGNTCFHNAATQLFYRMEELIPFLINEKVKRQYKSTEYISYFIDLLVKMSSNADNNQDKPIKNESGLVVGKICPILGKYTETRGEYISGYRPYTQADSQNFLDLILKSILIRCEPANELSLNINKSDVCIKTKNSDGQEIYIQTKRFPNNDPRTFFSVIYEEYSCVLDKITGSNILGKKKDVYPESYKNTKNKNDKSWEELVLALGKDEDYIKHNETILNEKYIKCEKDNNFIKRNTATIEHQMLSLEFQRNTAETMEQIIKDNMNCNYNILDKFWAERNKKSDGDIEYIIDGRKRNFIPNKYLMIHLKAFGKDIHGNDIKLSHNIKLANNNGEMVFSYLLHNNWTHKEYELVGLVNHVGGLNGGHYFSYIKHSTGWYYYDDMQVPIRQKVTGASWRGEPYIVMYREKNPKIFDTLDPKDIPDDLMQYLQDNR